MMLMKDNKTGNKSITITCLAVTFILTVAACVANIIILVNGMEPHPSLVWACLGFNSPFVALYWQKRIKASATGIEFQSDGSSDVESSN